MYTIMDYGADVYCLEYILKVLGFCSLLLMKDRYRYLFLNTTYALVWSTMMT